jgi:hypothetical protein
VTVLVAAVVLVGVLCLVDLLLTFGVIRRLREHAELITLGGVPDIPVLGVAAGEQPAPFSATTTEGDLVSGPGGLAMVAFFSTTCSACPERVPPFVSYLSHHGIARESALAVVLGPQDEPPAFATALAGAARVTTAPELEDNPLTRAFKVVGYPAFCLLDDDGTVIATSHDPAALPEAAAAP